MMTASSYANLITGQPAQDEALGIGRCYQIVDDFADIGFAALAIDENDVERALRLLATVRSAARFPFRTPLEVLVYRRCVRAVGCVLDSDAARLCRAEGAATPIDDALDAELGRLGAATPLEIAHGT